MKNTGIAVSGSILVDIINTVSKYPNEGELTQISSVRKAVGGCVPNVAIALKKLSPSLDVFASGKVSNDDNGVYAINVLKNNNVDTKNIVASNNDKTSFTQVMSISGGQRTFFTYPGSSAGFGVKDIDFDKLCPKMFHLGYFLLLQKVDDGDGIKILKKAIEKGIKTSIDLVSENSDRYKKILPCLPHTDYLIINELEGGRLTDIEPTIDNVSTIAKKLIELGVREKVVIHYSEGSVCVSKNGDVTILESFTLPKGYIKGTTGAGDAFCAGVLLGIYNDLSDKEILNYGRTAAVMALRESDATSGLVTMEEAKEIISQFERE